MSQNKSSLEELAKNVLPQILSYLDNPSVYSVSRCSRTLFNVAKPMLGARKAAEPFKEALIKRDFVVAGELLRAHPTLKDFRLSFNANPYYKQCPVRVMTPFEYAVWLDDDPMIEVVTKNSHMDRDEVSAQLERLKKRLAPGNDFLDEGRQFNLPKLLKIVDVYVRNQSKDNLEDLRRGLRHCPKYILDTFVIHSQ